MIRSQTYSFDAFSSHAAVAGLAGIVFMHMFGFIRKVVDSKSDFVWSIIK